MSSESRQGSKFADKVNAHAAELAAEVADVARGPAVELAPLVKGVAAVYGEHWHSLPSKTRPPSPSSSAPAPT